jgi:hypothetical protein
VGGVSPKTSRPLGGACQAPRSEACSRVPASDSAQRHGPVDSSRPYTTVG